MHLGRTFFDRWTATAVIAASPARVVLHGQPVDDPSAPAHQGATLLVLKPTKALQAVLESDPNPSHPQVQSEHVQPLLAAELTSTEAITLAVPADGAVSLATRLLSNAPDLPTLVGLLGDVTQGLAAIAESGRTFEVLSPEHILITSSGDGHEIAQLPPVWWSWKHGGNTVPAEPWICPHPSAPVSARQAWTLGAVLWQALTGTPPSLIQSEPKLHAQLPDQIAPDLASMVERLLGAPQVDEEVDLTALAQDLRTLAGDMEESNVYIAPPMLLGTPIPAGNQLRQPAGALPIPPPPGTPKAMTPRPSPTFGLIKDRPAKPPESAEQPPPDPGLITQEIPSPITTPAPSATSSPDPEPSKAEGTRASPLQTGMLIGLVLVAGLLILYLLGVLG